MNALAEFRRLTVRQGEGDGNGGGGSEESLGSAEKTSMGATACAIPSGMMVDSNSWLKQEPQKLPTRSSVGLSSEEPCRMYP